MQTLLSLVPKISDVEHMTDYRPIVCCNDIYKVFPMRLKVTLPSAIELNQCDVKGRLLLKNVLLATELLKDCHKQGISSRAAIKVDISKAFDTV